MKKFKFGAIAASLLLSFGASTAANAAATPILFDTNGAAAGGVISVSTFDWSPDNALAVGATPLSLNPGAPTSFNLYAQGRLGNFLDSGGLAIGGTGLGTDYEITFEAGFSELGTNSVIPGAAIAQFQLDPMASVNFFNIYRDTSKNANQLAGTGYNDGDLILSGFALSNNTSFLVTLDANGAPTIVALDNFTGAGNNYPGVGTVVGQGGGQLESAVSSYDTDYFKSDFSQFIVDLFFNTSNITPFNQADPAAQVVGNAPVFGAASPGFANGTNGFGNGVSCATGVTNCDFMFQADANQSFQAVPEPSSLALLGLALGAFGFMGARRRKSA